MNSRIISILIGATLASSTGYLVYAKKNSAVLPPEIVITEATSTIAQAPVVKKDVQSKPMSVKALSRKEDDEGEDEGKASGATTAPVSAPSASVPVQQKTSAGITLADVAKHNSRTSCWSAVNGSVYDLTSWIPNHPGGERVILSMCGIDGSAGYNGQHGGKSKPATILAGFKLGPLAQ
jgi:cytochrome b involved in lipid metabolism